MSLPLFAPTPWDEIVRIGIPYHGYWDSDFNAWSRSGTQIDLSDKNYDIVYGPVRIFDFGMPAISTNEEESAAGIYWANYAVFSGPFRIYNSIKSNGISTQIKLNKNAWLYKTSDKQTYIMTVWSGQIYAERLFHPRAAIGDNSVGQALFNMSGYGTPVFVNSSKTGKNAAIKLSSSAILEITVSGGSKTEYPTISVTRYRTSDQLYYTSYTLPTPTGHVIDDAGDQWLWPEGVFFSPAEAFHMSGANGIFRSIAYSILAVDFDKDSESSVDLGYSTIATRSFTCDFGTGWGADPTKEWQTIEATISVEQIIFCGSKKETWFKSSRYFPPQTVSYLENLTGTNPSGFDFTYTVELSVDANPYLIHGCMVVLANIAPRYYFSSGVEYQYNDTVNIYGYACQFGSGFNKDKIANDIPYLFFSVNPFSGNYESGKIGYF